MQLKYIAIWALALVLLACENQIESPFPEGRDVETELSRIEEKLVSQEYGWKFVLQPEGQSVGGFNMTVKFNADGSSEMVSEYILKSGGTIAYDGTIEQQNVQYRIRKVSNFELSFQSYCFVHKLYDLGYLSAFQFRIEATSGDSILLADGKQEFYMTPATADDWSMQEYNLNELKFLEYRNNATLFNYLKVGSTNIQLSWNHNARNVSLYYFDERGEIASEERGYYFTQKGLKLKAPIEVPEVGEISYFDFTNITTVGNAKALNGKVNGQTDGMFYSSVLTMVPVSDGLEHFHLVEGSSYGNGKFWSSRPAFEGGFTYGETKTYFGLENHPGFEDFNIYLNYFNDRIPAEYDNFTFVFYNEVSKQKDYHNVYFLYDTKGTDQIYFALDSVKGDNGFSGSFNPVVKNWVMPMVEKLIQPEGFTVVSVPGTNPIDASYGMYLVDNKDNGYMYMITGTLGSH